MVRKTVEIRVRLPGTRATRSGSTASVERTSDSTRRVEPALWCWVMKILAVRILRGVVSETRECRARLRPLEKAREGASLWLFSLSLPERSVLPNRRDRGFTIRDLETPPRETNSRLREYHFSEDEYCRSRSTKPGATWVRSTRRRPRTSS